MPRLGPGFRQRLEAARAIEVDHGRQDVGREQISPKERGCEDRHFLRRRHQRARRTDVHLARRVEPSDRRVGRLQDPMRLWPTAS